MMKRVIVTGGTGFVGANLVRRLLRDGHEVHLFVRSSYAGWRIDDIRNNIHVHEIDLCDAEEVTSLMGVIRPHWVFHLAAHGAYSWQQHIREMVQTNLIATINLVEASVEAGVESFIHAGSSSEYGFKDHAPTETTWLEPNSSYAVTKASATLYCRYMAQQHDAHIVTLRLYSVFGPYEEPGRLMPTVILHGLAGKLPPLVNPDIARDYVYTEDVNEAFLRVSAQTDIERGCVYNVGTGIQTTLRDVIETAQKVLPIRETPQWGSMESRQWDTSVWVADNRAIVQSLGWHPTYAFEQGFREMVAWFEANPLLLEWYQGKARHSRQ